MAALLAATAIAAGPALGVSTAYAVDGPTVSFTGGGNLIVCRSAPSEDRITVNAESMVIFTNRLDRTATLRVDGEPVAMVGVDQGVPVIFHHGQVSVSMTFRCDDGLIESFSSTLVSVTPASPPRTLSTAGPRPAASQVAAAKATGGAGRAGGTGRVGGTGGNPPGPARATKAAGAGARGGGHPATTSDQQSVQVQQDTTGDAPAVNPDEPVPALPALPAPSAAAATAVPSITGTQPRADGATRDGGGAGSPAVAIEPLVPASGTPKKIPSGLLALLATVCAVGVTIAATRVIISKRTIRTHRA